MIQRSHRRSAQLAILYPYRWNNCCHTYGNDGKGNTGHVRVYQWDGSTWIQKGADIDGEAAEDRSGNSLSLSSDGTTVAIGAWDNDGNGFSYATGHVRVCMGGMDRNGFREVVT